MNGFVLKYLVWVISFGGAAASGLLLKSVGVAGNLVTVGLALAATFLISLTDRERFWGTPPAGEHPAGKHPSA